MNLSMKWLSDYIKADMPIKEFADGMTMSGSKVEKWTELSAPLSNIVIGMVSALEKHPDAEKLWVAQADVGGDVPVQIVTAAQNLFVGAYVPVVLDGGVVFNYHDGTITKIKKGKFRGVKSDGMMCGYQELGVPHEYLPYAATDGILILNDAPLSGNSPPSQEGKPAVLSVGSDAIEFLGLKDTVVEFEITNNRPDCLSVLGLAKEVSATFELPLKLPVCDYKFEDNGESLALSVEVLNKELCPRYMAAVVKNVKIAPSPRWLQERLRASGVRPINNYVDITNFVMLEYGHPMHAFDKKYLSGDKIIVRNAAHGEKITLLDGSEQLLSEEMLVIADAQQPVAIAGVMGGEFSSIMDDTKEVVFESACFNGVSTRKSAKKIGRRTESSARFEKGLPPEGASAALYRALQLVKELDCGDVLGNIIDIAHFKSSAKTLVHDAAKVNQILGTDIPKTEQLKILKKLGFLSEEQGSVIKTSVERSDVERQCDLAEEIARIYGYNKIKSTVPKLEGGGIERRETFKRAVEQTMIGEGCFECMSVTFISPKSYEKAGVCATLRDSVVIRNPLGETMSVMRTCMSPSMLEILSRNFNNRVTQGRFYEIGRVYVPTGDELPDERQVLCIGMYGEDEGFFTLKGLVETLMENIGVRGIEYIGEHEAKTYHPGRCAKIQVGKTQIGILGECHPKVCESFKINARAYMAEIELEPLYELTGTVPKFKALPKHPALIRDLSLVCDDEIPAAKVEEIIRKNGKFIEQLDFFDVYKGAQIPSGKKSLSYKLVLRKPDTTLTDEQADKSVALILKALAQNNIELRKEN
ncbi:MAG: phenylalanine--tRNA ligase subunit beta [Oscillospiraceae bacterium]|nr:phenylalanine--tRNA ligase subunit beta [Oscillospiraceae bacterium]